MLDLDNILPGRSSILAGPVTGAAALRGGAPPLALLDLVVVAEPVAGGLRSARGIPRA